jgi:UPF0755 protein
MNRTESKYITIKDWIIFFVTTFLIFLSSILLAVSAVIFFFFHLIKRAPVLILGCLICLLLFYVSIQWLVIPIPWKAEKDSVSILVRPGDSMSRIVQGLNEAKIINDGRGLLFLAKLLGKDRHIQVGRYDFQKGMTLYSVFTKLSKGDVNLSQVTIPEGRTIKQIAGILQREIKIDSSDFVGIATDSLFARSLGVPASTLEGYLFPDTYKFSWGTSSEKIARMMADQFKQTFTDSLQRRAEAIGFTLTEVVSLASLIEAEVKVEEERKIISAVYHNRLKRRMLLQSCPTVIYALPEVELPLLLKHLEIDSPYNTYKHPGLPPGPICNPGRASILAALYPAEVNYIYFVSKGDGTHIFSSTLIDHNRARDRVKQIQKSKM